MDYDLRYDFTKVKIRMNNWTDDLTKLCDDIEKSFQNEFYIEENCVKEVLRKYIGKDHNRLIRIKVEILKKNSEESDFSILSYFIAMLSFLVALLTLLYGNNVPQYIQRMCAGLFFIVLCLAGIQLCTRKKNSKRNKWRKYIEVVLEDVEKEYEQRNEKKTIPNEPETPDENTEITLEFVKQKKISEMSKECENCIIAGADVALTDGRTYHFSFTEHDQSRVGLLASFARMSAILEQMGMTTDETEQSYPWNADNGDCVYYSRDDMILIGTAYESTVTYHKSYFHALRDYINAMDNIQDVVDVSYGVDVPEEYWGVVYTDIMSSLGTEEGRCETDSFCR